MIRQMKDSEYFSLPYYSSTAIRDYIRFPRKNVDHSYIQNLDKAASAAQLLGSLVHKALGEPQEFKLNEEIYMSMLTPAKQRDFMKCVSAARADRFTSKLLSKAQNVEEVFLFDVPAREGEKPLKCKAKLDGLVPFEDDYLLFDLKTTGRRLEHFADEIKKYRYDIQLAFYSEAASQNNRKIVAHIIAAIETSYPHEARCFKLSDDMIASADEEWRRALEEMHFNPKPRFEGDWTDVE